jgi:hypothetical protein
MSGLLHSLICVAPPLQAVTRKIALLSNPLDADCFVAVARCRVQRGTFRHSTTSRLPAESIPLHATTGLLDRSPKTQAMLVRPPTSTAFLLAEPGDEEASGTDFFPKPAAVSIENAIAVMEQAASRLDFALARLSNIKKSFGFKAT